MWDYVGDNYVHRLIQSKTDGKLVELNHHCTHGDGGCDICKCGSDSAYGEAILSSKVEAVCRIIFVSHSVEFCLKYVVYFLVNCLKYFVIYLFLVLLDLSNLLRLIVLLQSDCQ